MLAADQLAELYRTHRDDMVLSVYLDGNQQDFAQRGKWRIALKSQIAAQRKLADDPDAFDRAVAHIEAELEPGASGFLASRGWVGFATADRCVYGEHIPVPMPNLVRWEPGLRVAPYARALKQTRPVVAALIDSRHARLLRYRVGRLRARGELQADTFFGDLTDVNVAKRASDHSGVRGQTSTDAARRVLEVERDRLIARFAEEVESEAGRDGFVVIGGPERVVAAFQKRLPGHMTNRVIREPTLRLDMTDAEILEAVEGAASTLSARHHDTLLGRLVDQAKSNGDACLGLLRTEEALREHRVDTMVISDTVRKAQPDLIDRFEGAAFDQGATVVEVSRDAAERLDAEGEGVGALLRYRVPA